MCQLLSTPSRDTFSFFIHKNTRESRRVQDQLTLHARELASRVSISLRLLKKGRKTFFVVNLEQKLFTILAIDIPAVMQAEYPTWTVVIHQSYLLALLLPLYRRLDTNALRITIGHASFDILINEGFRFMHIYKLTIDVHIGTISTRQS